jgi:hypothetical protein
MNLIKLPLYKTTRTPNPAYRWWTLFTPKFLYGHTLLGYATLEPPTE